MKARSVVGFVTRSVGLSVLALAAADCGPPGPGPFEGMYPHSPVTITTTSNSTHNPQSSAINDTITITSSSSSTMYDMLITVPVSGGTTCTFGATRNGSTATIVSGQTCSVAATGYSYVATSGADSTATINDTALTLTILGTYAASSILGTDTGTFQLTATGSRQ